MAKLLPISLAVLSPRSASSATLALNAGANLRGVLDTAFYSPSVKARDPLHRAVQFLGSTTVDALHALWTAAKVCRYLWADTVMRRDSAEQVVESLLMIAEEYGFGCWAIHVSHQPR